MVSLCVWLCTKLTNAQTLLHDPLAFEAEAFEPMKKKQLDTSTKSDDVFLISKLLP